MVIETKVTEKHGTGQDQGSGVGLVLALDVETDVTATGLEDSNVTAHVAAGDDTSTTDEGSANVGQNATVKVRHDHDVELLGLANSLHGGVVDNHVVDLEGGVVVGDTVEGGTEETVSQLHDVGLVNAGDLLAVVGQSEVEGELGDALRLGAGDDLKGLDDTGDRLVLEARVLTLGVLTDDCEIDTLVAGLVAGDVLDEGDGGVDVELLAHGDVEGLVAGALNGSVQDTLEAELVAAEGGDGLAEEVLGLLGGGGVETRDLDLLPLNGDIVGLEDGLDALGDLGTDTVTRDQRDRVLAAKLGRLEDVRADRGVGARGLRGAQNLRGGGLLAICPWVIVAYLAACVAIV